MKEYSFFEVQKFTDKRIAILFLNHPDKRNAMDWSFWRDLPLVVEEIEQDKGIRSVVIMGKGKSFSTGLDIGDFFEKHNEVVTGAIGDIREDFYRLLLQMQEGFKRIYESEKVYIAAVHKHCIGGGLDLISACDIRLGTKDASVSLRETKVAIVADMGSLNRLPSIIGQGNTRNMAFTGKDFSGEECLRMCLFSEIFETKEELDKAAIRLAEDIAANPGMAVRGTKQILNYMDNHSIDEGMKYVAAWNAAFLDNKDFRELVSAFREKRQPNFI
ncbi:MAG: enoyl-CoA hydratase/isomerase family protein [Leptospira sp.]|nr:enoyl-CoA hydratase/isomerase family protein [Leptospira sp.]